MNYFEAIAKRCAELDALAEERMKGLPFISCPDMVDFLWVEAHRIFKTENEDWDAVPDWVGYAMDGFIPFTQPPHNGSIYHALGFSMQAMEYNLRLYYEAVKAGRDPDGQEFVPCLAEKEIVDAYAQEDAA